MLDQWLSEPGFEEELAELPDIDPTEIRLAPDRFPAMNSLSRRVLGRFAEMCGGNKAEGARRWKVEGRATDGSNRPYCSSFAPPPFLRLTLRCPPPRHPLDNPHAVL